MKTLTTRQREIIQNFVDDQGEDDEVSVYENYSGRGMFGKNCFGFSLGRYTNSHMFIVGLISHLYDANIRPIIIDEATTEDDEKEFEEYENLIEMLNSRIDIDSLGLGTILYFPNVAWE